MKSKIVFILLMAVLLFSSSCITAKQFEMLQTDIAGIQEKVTRLEKEVSSTHAAVEGINDKIKNQAQMSQSEKADVQLKIDSLSGDIQILLDRLTDTNHRISILSQEIQATKDLFRTMPPGVSPPLAGEGTPLSSEGAAAPLSQPEELFKSAYADYSKGNYALAISGLREYIQRFPKSDLTDNAQYWIGECHYSQGDYQTAIEEFDKVIENFPDGDKVPGAHLKKAFALFELNQTAKGVILLQYLINRYPKSDEARIAKDKLKSIGAGF
ncbi:MAG: tol-pal system protein YbgF [Acidobacteriota bacterium]